MLRRLFAVLSLAALSLLALPALASAEQPPYPAPPVTPTADPSWAPSSYPVAPVANVTDPGTQLASTGAGLNVELVVLIAVAILAIGAGLLIVGAKLRGRATNGR